MEERFIFSSTVKDGIMALRRLSSQIKAMPFFMELTGVGFFTFSPLISMVPPDMRRMP
jgi:hypothetical protein